MRVLFVEDSASLRRSVGRALRHAGFAVDLAGDGEEGWEAVEMNDYDAIILDILMPRLDGLSLLRRMRGAGKMTHVLLLTARDTVDDRVEGLRAGADDYLVKPFAVAELVARVEALCRRAYGTKTSVLRSGEFEIDLASRCVRRGGEDIELTAREWRLLEYLARRRGQVVPRSEIEAHIYDELVSPMSNVVDAAVYGLRRKLGAGLVETRRGLGYLFDAK